MHINDTKKVLDNFLKFKEKQALYLKGAWGVGKTYFWKDYISERKQIHEDYYSYVSLFGANKIEDVRGSIVVNTLKVNEQKAQSGLKKLLATILRVVPKSWKKSAINLPKLIKDTPLLSGYGGIITTFEHALINKAINNYLICFDDLERRAKGLSIDEILGLASQLKEEKKCRIIFILNEDEVSKEDREALQSYKEKVIDVEVEFNPSVVENLNHIFKSIDRFYKLILSKSQLLELRNIRIIQRIKRNVDYLTNLMQDCEHSLQEELVSHIILVTYVYSNPKSQITVESLKKFNAIAASLAAMKKETDQKTQERTTFLANYGYTYKDYDNYIIEYVERGVVDEDGFTDLLSKLDEREKVAQIKKQVQDIWNIFARSFKGTEDEFITSLISFLDENASHLTLQEFSDLENLTKELGFDLDKYKETVVNANLDSLSFHDLDSLLHSPYIPARFHDEIKSRIDHKKEDFNITEIFKKIVNKNSWSTREIEFLSACDVDDFYNWISTEDDSDLFYYINQGLKFRGMNSNAAYSKIGETIAKALEKVGSRSRFDKLRVERVFNIPVPNDE